MRFLALDDLLDRDEDPRIIGDLATAQLKQVYPDDCKH